MSRPDYGTHSEYDAGRYEAHQDDGYDSDRPTRDEAQADAIALGDIKPERRPPAPPKQREATDDPWAEFLRGGAA